MFTAGFGDAIVVTNALKVIIIGIFLPTVPKLTPDSFGSALGSVTPLTENVPGINDSELGIVSTKTVLSADMDPVFIKLKV